MARISAVTGDITTFAFDAIVNAANSSLQGGGGVDGAIHTAGGPRILEECREWVRENGPLPTGQAMATTAGNMPAKNVIHTVGPIYARHGPREARRLLGDCYRNSLRLAVDMGCKSIAFPNISTGVYGYPKGDAAAVAVSAVTGISEAVGGPEEIVFVCFDEANYELYRGLLDF